MLTRFEGGVATPWSESGLPKTSRAAGVSALGGESGPSIIVAVQCRVMRPVATV